MEQCSWVRRPFRAHGKFAQRNLGLKPQAIFPRPFGAVSTYTP